MQERTDIERWGRDHAQGSIRPDLQSGRLHRLPHNGRAGWDPVILDLVHGAQVLGAGMGKSPRSDMYLYVMMSEMYRNVIVLMGARW